MVPRTAPGFPTACQPCPGPRVPFDPFSNYSAFPTTAMDFSEQLSFCRTLIRSGALADAERECSELLNRCPDDPAALNLMGVLQRQAERLDEAEASFLQALDRAPGNPALQRNLARVRQAAGNGDAAATRLLAGFGYRCWSARVPLVRSDNFAGVHRNIFGVACLNDFYGVPDPAVVPPAGPGRH